MTALPAFQTRWLLVLQARRARLTQHPQRGAPPAGGAGARRPPSRALPPRGRHGDLPRRGALQGGRSAASSRHAESGEGVSVVSPGCFSHPGARAFWWRV